MTKLKPCPFCGGRQTYRKHDGAVWLTRTNHKRDCIMREALSFVAFATEAEAIAAWNTRTERVDERETINKTGDFVTHDNRAERTCEFNIKDNMNETEGMGDVWIECSACHCAFDYFADDWLMKMSYCPNCGAKVVGE